MIPTPSQEEGKDGSRQVILGWGGTEADTGQLRKDREKTVRLFEQMQEKRLINCNTHSQFKKKNCALSKFGIQIHSLT